MRKVIQNLPRVLCLSDIPILIARITLIQIPLIRLNNYPSFVKILVAQWHYIFFFFHKIDFDSKFESPFPICYKKLDKKNNRKIGIPVLSMGRPDNTTKPQLSLHINLQ